MAAQENVKVIDSDTVKRIIKQKKWGKGGVTFSSLTSVILELWYCKFGACSYKT